MAEAPSLPIIEEEELGDEFYEKIEAPKFVDFTAPEIRRSHDDRYWFCLRVGCDQNHGEELDSEAIYKNFVLRVMAARSPNVRLRKALNRREASANLKCPLTAPAKSSKSRVSRLALISSTSKNMVDNNERTRPLSKVSATPNAKVKQSAAAAKALTTPSRNQKKSSNLEQFRTVQSKKAMSVVVPKNRVIAKALVFHSPKRPVKIKSSIELKKTPMKSLCSAMKKLELDSVKKKNEEASRRKFRGREVKSRVFDSLYPNRCLKEEKKLKGISQIHEGGDDDNESSDMEIDERSRGGSLERCHESSSSEEAEKKTSEECEENEQKRESTKAMKRNDNKENCLASDDDKENEGEFTENDEKENAAASNENRCHESSSSEEAKKKTSEECEENEQKRESTKAMKRNDNKENCLASDDDKENEGEFTENDEKENAAASDENRALVINHDNLKKAKHEETRKTPKKPISNAAGSQVVKYRKLKPTNPKPFKLRTDERGILKEANLVKETTGKGGKAIRKHQSVNQKNEQDTDSNGCEERPGQATEEDKSGSSCYKQNMGSTRCSSALDNSNVKVKTKLSATPHRSAAPKLRKPIGLAERLKQRDNKAAQKLDDKFKRKSQVTQPTIVKPRGVLSRKKENVPLATPSKQLSVIDEKSSSILQPKEASKPCNNGALPTSKVSGANSGSCSRAKKATTVPKEPNFHSLHVPKSCTKKLT